MNIRLPFFAFFLAVSFIMNAQNNSAQEQIKNEISDTITATSMLTSKKPEPQQSDSNELAQIRQNTEDTAKHTKKDGFDIWGIIISALAFITAGITLFFTIRTYKSQRQTQKNTTPVFTKEKQYEVLTSFAVSLIEELIEAGVVKLKMCNDPSSGIPSNLLFPEYFIDSSELHLELFYDDNREKYIEKNSVDQLFNLTTYIKVSDLKSEIDSFNKAKETLSQQIINHSADLETIKKEYDEYVFESILSLLVSIANICDDIFDSIPDSKIRKLIIHYVYIIKLTMCVHEYNGGVRGHLVDYNTNFEELKKVYFENINGVDELFANAMKYWNYLYEDYYFPYALPKMKNLDMKGFIDFVKIIIAAEYKKDNIICVNY